jgi:general stress protein 26
MSDSSFIQIYRDFLTDTSFVNCPPSYRCVLFTILANACWAPCQQDDHGVLIDLKPGQFMCTIRHLAEISNVGRKDAEHAVKMFLKMKILGQTVGHKKSIFTILRGIKLINSGTNFGTKMGQERDRKEENKKQEHVVVSAESAICLSVERSHPNGKKFKASLEEVFSYALNNRKSWTTEEIHEAWQIFCDYQAPISDFLLFIEGTINIKRNKKPADQKWKSQTKNTKINLKSSSMSGNEFYSENATSESPLAKFALQNGFK